MVNWALAIGINTYQRLQSLTCAVRDAEAMSQFLAAARFDQIFYFADNSPEIIAPDGSYQSTQPTYANLWSFLVDFFETPFLGDGDNFWFFFSGHGIRHEGRDYLMPCDGNPRAVENTAIALNYVTERLRGCGADNVVLFLDACRNEGAKDGLGIGSEKQKGVITIASCSPREKSYEIEQLGQGSFTYALLEALQLQGESNCATVERLCNRLRWRVREINQAHEKPLQVPYSIVEPETKYHYILLPHYIRPNESDIAALREDAFEAEAEGNLMAAKQLLRRVWALDPGNLRVMNAYDRVVLKLAQQQGTPPAEPPKVVTSNTGSKATPVAPPPKPVLAPLDAVELKSEKDADYTKLRGLLKAQKWKEADKETARVMLEVAGQTEQGWLDRDDIAKFPCADLRTIDRLWVVASEGRFGFSVQKEIYESLGGTKDYNEEIWTAFGDRVGWRKGDKWLYYTDLTFNLSAQKGHLPGLGRLGVFVGGLGVVGRGLRGGCGWVSSLASRLVKCNI